MWAHYIYLLLLPTLAIVSSQIMFSDADFQQALLILGFPPVLMFTLFLANGYALPGSLPVALLVVLAIPLQIAVSVYLFGGGSVWLFFAESAAVEINSFLLGTLFSAFSIRRKEFGNGIIIFSAIALAIFFGGVSAYIALVFYGYGGFSPWLILFITSFAAAFWQYAKVYRSVVEISRKKRVKEHVEMKFDSGFLTKILGIKSDVPLITPFKKPDLKRYELSTPVLIFGFTALFLPIVVGLILGVALR